MNASDNESTSRNAEESIEQYRVRYGRLLSCSQLKKWEGSATQAAWRHAVGSLRNIDQSSSSNVYLKRAHGKVEHIWSYLEIFLKVSLRWKSKTCFRWRNCDVSAVRARRDSLRCSCSQLMLVRRAAPLLFHWMSCKVFSRTKALCAVLLPLFRLVFLSICFLV